MNIAQDSWSYVIASYVVTWVVILGYSMRLISMKRRLDAANSSMRL